LKLDPKQIKEDESQSNPMVVAFSTEECPLPERRPCFFIVVGPGTMHEPCQHFRDNCTMETPDVECRYDANMAANQLP